MNLYIREVTSKLEFLNLRNILKKLNFIKNNVLKKCLKKIIKLFINLEYNYYYFLGKVVEKPQNNFTECLIPMEEKNSKRIIFKWKNNINYILNNSKYEKIIIS